MWRGGGGGESGRGLKEKQLKQLEPKAFRAVLGLEALVWTWGLV